MTNMGSYRAKRPPRATVAVTEKDRVVLTVDMDQYETWLRERLPRTQVDTIMKINSRQGMLAYFEQESIDFVFPEQPELNFSPEPA